MTGFTSYSVENDKKFAQAIDRSLKAVNDLRVPYAQIAKDFYKSRKAIFQLKSAGQYPDLKETYKTRKQAAVGFIYPILKLTGALEKSVTGTSDPNNITRINPKILEMGTAIEYGVYHQEGRGVPLRKFLFIGPESVKFGNKEIDGFPTRALNTLNTYVLRQLGANIQQATGVKPRINQEKI